MRALWHFLKQRKTKSLEIYTDGSLKHGRGTWAYVFVENGKTVKEGCGRLRPATCVQMEFHAAIEALRALEPNSKATLFSDSRIVVDALTKPDADGKKRPGIHAEQIKLLHHLAGHHSISWKWVRAHTGIEHNERCDQLCILARDPSFCS